MADDPKTKLVDHLWILAVTLAWTGDIGRAHGYARAALAIRSLPGALPANLSGITGVGSSVVEVWEQVRKTGSSERFCRIDATLSRDDHHGIGVVMDLAEVLGPVEAVKVYREHGARTKADVEALRKDGKITVPAAKVKADAAALVKQQKDEDEAAWEAQIQALDTPLFSQPQMHRRFGELHCHTNFSSGDATAHEMVEAAHRLGYTWLGISDHYSGSQPKCVGFESFDLYLSKIDAAEEWINSTSSWGFRVLRGLEVDVGLSGVLLAPPDTMERVDYVIASLHLQPGIRAAERLEHAFRHPKVKVWAHPSGRVRGAVKPADVDYTRAFRACLQYGVSVEINCRKERLDPPLTVLELAFNMGVRFTISSDARDPEELEETRYGYVLQQQLAIPWSRIDNHNPRISF